MTALILILIFFVAANLFLLYRFMRLQSLPPKIEQKGDDIGLKLILEQVNELSRVFDGKLGDLTKTVDTKITESGKNMNDSVRIQFSESATLIRHVTEGLTKLDETNRQVVSFADQLQSLQDILKNPKQRGILGEYYLETLLKNALPPGSYKMQHAFSDGTIVDAAVFVKDKVIPIDSKFSLENYNRVVEAKDKDERERLKREPWTSHLCSYRTKRSITTFSSIE
jgi:DNA recombination protein RmuC